jgi:tetratricopeptide (TPR) repeat protein
VTFGAPEMRCACRSLQSWRRNTLGHHHRERENLRAESIERILLRVVYVVAAIALVAIVIAVIPGGQDRVQGFYSALQSRTEQPDIGSAEQAIKDGDKTQALDIAAKLMAASSSDASVDNRAGNVAVQAGDSAAAERYYRSGESADDRNPWNYVALGELYAREANYPQADTQLRAALTILPSVQFIHYDLGVVELKEHLYDAALQDFKAELKLSPGYGPAVAGERQALAATGNTSGLRALTQVAAAPKVSRSPSPRPSPAASNAPSPSPSPSPTSTPTPAPSPSPTALALATIAVPTPPAQTPAPAVHKQPKPAHTAAAVKPINTAAPTTKPVPSRTPRTIADLSTDAKSYLVGVASDLGFTQSVPAADPTVSTSTIQGVISSAQTSSSVNIGKLVDAGASALLSGRLSLANSAFVVASAKAPTDWRGPFFAGLTAQARGDDATAIARFNEAVGRGAGAEALVSLAVSQIDAGDDAAALASAKRAAALAPSYEPARFTAGMAALISADVPTAESELQAALGLGSAPARTSYFLSTLRQREGG